MPFASLKLLVSRNYGLLWWTGFISDAGTWMQTVAIGALVTDLTGSAGWGSLTAAVSFLMTGLGTPFAGVLADNHDRRRLLLGAAIAGAVIAIMLAAVYANGHASPPFIIFNVALEGLILAVAWPTRSALFAQIVEPEQVPDAIALGPASWNLGRAVGPALAGVIIIHGSYTWIFVANAISFVVVALGLCRVKVRPHGIVKSEASVRTRLKSGVQAVRSEPGCKLALIVMSVVALTVAPFIALIPAMAQLAFGGTPVDTAHFVTAQGVGSIVGAFTFGGFVARFGVNRVLRLAIVVVPVAVVLYALSPTTGLAIAFLGLIGFFYVWLLVSLNTIVQMRSEPEFRGRAVSLYVMTLSLFYPVGATIQGWLADVFGVREVLSTGAATLFVISVLVMAVGRRRLDVLDTPRVVDVSETEAVVATSSSPGGRVVR